MHIAHLACAENELLASLLKDELRFVLRKHVRGAAPLLLPLHDLAGEANDSVVLIGLSVNRYGAECGAFDLHGLILLPGFRTRLQGPRRNAQAPSPPPGHPWFLVHHQNPRRLAERELRPHGALE